ncbi:TCP-1/cpn60 chaperonin family protein [Xanthobacter autotrophicus]|uniref:TCP-1/cpn60 chaperonin family protein n=2 Tax=Xanthobacteraceae TaxID=335928 RepID=UPI0024A7A03B|nr:TCP-1/cpn60 chaperonin family protein [Xanthobacter autotrophicus]
MGDLAKAAASSLGPCGRTVLIEHVGKLTPNVVKDGSAICRAIEYREPEKEVGRKLLALLGKEIERDFGDGVSGTLVATAAVLEAVVRALAAYVEPKSIVEGLRLGVEDARAALEDLRRPVTVDRIRRILPNAVFSEGAIAVLVSDAFREVGAEGDVRAEIADTIEDSLEIVQGARYEKGYLSSAFVTDKRSMRVEFDAPLVLLTDRVLDDFGAIAPALAVAAEKERPIVVVAGGFDENVRAGLIMNNARGRVRCAAVQAPAYGETLSDFVADLAVLTGARAFLEGRGDSLATLVAGDLGGCERIFIDERSTLIRGGQGSEEALRQRIHEVRAQLAFHEHKTKSFTSKMGLQETAGDRIRFLQGKYAEISIGGRNDLTIKYRLALANKAIGVTRVLLRGGAVPGGGTGLSVAARRLRDRARISVDPGVKSGLLALAEGLAKPQKVILRNAGGETAGGESLGRWSGLPWAGIDATTGNEVDLWAAGIADPFELAIKVVDCAASLAEMICRTGALLVKSPVDIGFSPEEAAATREVM